MGVRTRPETEGNPVSSYSGRITSDWNPDLGMVDEDPTDTLVWIKEELHETWHTGYIRFPKGADVTPTSGVLSDGRQWRRIRKGEYP